MVVDLAMGACGSEEATNAFIRWVEVCAKDLVNVFWPEVEAVARALLERAP
jgi:hypothetical protein